MKALPYTLTLLTLLTACGQTETPPKETQKEANQVAVQTTLKTEKALKPMQATQPALNQTAPLDEHALQKAAIKAFSEQLTRLTENKACDTHQQCKVIAAGSRACGGPSHYLIYSTKVTSEKKIKEVASKLTHHESQYNAANRMQSICEMLTPPRTQCIKNTCVNVSDRITSTH